MQLAPPTAFITSILGSRYPEGQARSTSVSCLISFRGPQYTYTCTHEYTPSHRTDQSRKLFFLFAVRKFGINIERIHVAIRRQQGEMMRFRHVVISSPALFILVWSK
jgi:hypothetical protein